MSITPIDPAGNIPRIAPVQRVQRAQAAALRFKLPGTELKERPAQRRKPSAGRRLVIHEDGFLREYGLLPDGTRILLTEEPDHSAHSLPLPRSEERVIPAAPDVEPHDPEHSMKASGAKLQSLLQDVGLVRRMRE
ncbi:hypothetical protein [Saccharibacillus sacchari]|uniref:Uncharacterized protein n=1 Tax=Saccharibacillus sacchari TaxID=456493 RepID=A0ACC6PHT2_9BACL